MENVGKGKSQNFLKLKLNGESVVKLTKIGSKDRNTFYYFKGQKWKLDNFCCRKCDDFTKSAKFYKVKQRSAYFKKLNVN